jgi:hypothetical protein
VPLQSPQLGWQVHSSGRGPINSQSACAQTFA